MRRGAMRSRRAARSSRFSWVIFSLAANSALASACALFKECGPFGLQFGNARGDQGIFQKPRRIASVGFEAGSGIRLNRSHALGNESGKLFATGVLERSHDARI